MPIVLASGSPRRQELLKDAGIEFVVRPANIEEVQRPGEGAAYFAERMAREKARAVHASSPDSIVLGADTIVVARDQVLGKPTDAADAVRMLRLLSNRQHFVITAVCLIGADSEGPNSLGKAFEDVRSEKTAVHFTPLADAEIRDYVSTGEPMDKAGAYAIQGGAARWISKIEGDYSNVVGLPVDLVLRMLREHGVESVAGG
jgi:septum formation protein